MIRSRGARTLLDRGSRLPDVLIFSASRPIKHCTKTLTWLLTTQRQGQQPGPVQFRGLRLMRRCKLSGFGDVAAAGFYETLTAPSARVRFECPRLECQESRVEGRDEGRDEGGGDGGGEGGEWRVEDRG